MVTSIPGLILPMSVSSTTDVRGGRLDDRTDLDVLLDDHTAARRTDIGVVEGNLRVLLIPLGADELRPRVGVRQHRRLILGLSDRLRLVQLLGAAELRLGVLHGRFRHVQIRLGLPQGVTRHARINLDQQLTRLDHVADVNPYLEQLTRRFRLDVHGEDRLDGARCTRRDDDVPRGNRHQLIHRGQLLLAATGEQEDRGTQSQCVSSHRHVLVHAVFVVISSRSIRPSSR
jgi:hypothetical protein